MFSFISAPMTTSSSVTSHKVHRVCPLEAHETVPTMELATILSPRDSYLMKMALPGGTWEAQKHFPMSPIPNKLQADFEKHVAREHYKDCIALLIMFPASVSKVLT
jgi:hypothetical protein